MSCEVERHRHQEALGEPRYIRCMASPAARAYLETGDLVRKSTLLRFAVAAVATPAIALSVAAPASAGDYVQWQNKGIAKRELRELCLSHGSADDVGLASCDSNGVTRWNDLQPSNNNPYHDWIERPQGTDMCLTAVMDSVQLSACYGSDAYQRWSEEQWNGGWVLKNRGSGLCLSARPDSGRPRDRLPVLERCDGQENMFWR